MRLCLFILVLLPYVFMAVIIDSYCESSKFQVDQYFHLNKTINCSVFNYTIQLCNAKYSNKYCRFDQWKKDDMEEYHCSVNSTKSLIKCTLNLDGQTRPGRLVIKNKTNDFLGRKENFSSKKCFCGYNFKWKMKVARHDRNSAMLTVTPEDPKDFEKVDLNGTYGLDNTTLHSFTQVWQQDSKSLRFFLKNLQVCSTYVVQTKIDSKMCKLRQEYSEQSIKYTFLLLLPRRPKIYKCMYSNKGDLMFKVLNSVALDFQATYSVFVNNVRARSGNVTGSTVDVKGMAKSIKNVFVKVSTCNQCQCANATMVCTYFEERSLYLWWILYAVTGVACFIILVAIIVCCNWRNKKRENVVIRPRNQPEKVVSNAQYVGEHIYDEICNVPLANITHEQSSFTSIS
ncbi:uncharacterized protein LOC130656253 [Hydractinia symbiolongicarpus]|uniref:uncharacterized protein LOC130656253 n=1 Tax=Hydractinia symbiolongicarpus TaxID=13093 RepID=UPI002550F551|nr:uncharacterized protein LOC130656253 [Hydractinia symbiolongicarpus]